MRITKLLSSDSTPAHALIDRAKSIRLTMLERVRLPETFKVDDAEIENGLGEVRPLEVGDVLVDEAGSFYKIEAAPEAVLKVTGDVTLMQEAVYAFLARGLRVAQKEDGFSVVALPQFKEMLEGVGLTVAEVVEPFVPLPLPRHGGCGCGGHRHHHNEEGCGCGCGGHHHHRDDEECSCGCGGHHHHHDDEECGCGCSGHHHHHDGEECSCGCGGHHHHHDEEECSCGCGGHQHHHDEKECHCGGHAHGYADECSCGCDKK